MATKSLQMATSLSLGVRASSEAAAASTDWRERIPVLAGDLVTLRELQAGDGPALMTMLASPEVARFMSPPPSTLGGFERMIEWAQRERAAGRYVCFAVVPQGSTVPVGLFQLKQTEKGFATAEWGFALGSPYWGSGMFVEAARLVIDFAVDIIGVHRLEARAAVANGRGNGALRKLGAVQEGTLRRSLLRNGRHVDQVMWSILADEWRPATPDPSENLVH